ncbi:SecD/SecF fusion protein [Aquimarina sp. EL_43]|uniref:protein translocase subunit SecDF n=1 Tax=unclassified Aquimarina TaxID=2627091 RepID=UPI0018CA93AE|nr:MULTISPECIES: protein translocase subunit SecDF [unclassified Aquimarina]MBG6128604.1 SecD/SecF fusion protein [Aquimarina sp. EL_35]MBG6149667.1 SecD/SecF fusion protein [Aquimarina sp. EL_32]MBG6167648.1 SecD/SecF fusion protein [Aquimarina sp. EL_43]
MQNKGLVRVFAILFGLVCIYQLSYTYMAYTKEAEAEIYAQQKYPESVKDYSKLRETAERNYLDSIGKEEIFAGITYNDAKDKELNKGLDLKGGINVILQISVKDILSGLANNSKDPSFNQALLATDEVQKNSQNNYIDDFFTEFEKIPDAKLASPDIFANKNLSDDITYDMTNEQVKPVLKRKIDESVVSAFEVLRKRIDKFGVTQPNIQRLGESGRILVELPGAKDIERVKSLVTSTAQLEFWDVYKMEEVFNHLIAANNLIKEELEGVDEIKEKVAETSETVVDSTQVDTAKVDSTTTDADAAIENLLEDAEDSTDIEAQVNPLFDLIVGQGRQGGPVVATVEKKNADQFMAYLNDPKVKALLPVEQRFMKFAWGKPEKDSEFLDLYAIKGNRDNEPELSGGVITDARQEYSQLGKVTVTMQMDGKGAKKWEEMTGRAFNQSSQIAVVLDDIVYSAPGVTTGAISGGRSEITGDFSIEEGQDLANVLRAGKLPASADIIQSEVVGPSLGQEAIDSGIMSFAIALVLILIWMVFYYGKAGLFADVALVVNILFIFGVLAGLKAVLTLPGIAGIVLTIGMSVDANVLIFERIREELVKGKSQVDAIKDGFSNALSSILDANITTGLTGLILLVIGTGPIKGFATTLLIGILTSLFTAIFVTRLFIDGYGKNGKELAFSTGATKNLFKNVNINFLKKRKVAYIISGIIIVAGIGSLFTNGLDQGVDFVGGRTYTVRFAKDVVPTVVEKDLVAAFESAQAKTYGTNNQLKITTKYKVDETGEEVDAEISNKLFTALKPYLTDGLTYDQFANGGDDKQVGIMHSMKVGPTIADDIKQAAFWSVLASLIVVFLYILLRFRRWQFSLGAVAAVFHDVLIVLGIFSLTYKFMPFNMEIDQAFIAAILTVIGYSLNDTVVVFDRIREFFNEHTGRPLDKNVNGALNSTLSRTLNTSLTTLLVLIAIFIFAVPLRGFMFSLIIGVIIGTYSSLFIATPVMYDTVRKVGLKTKEKVTEEKKK